MPGSEHRDAYLHQSARVLARVEEAFRYVKPPSRHIGPCTCPECQSWAQCFADPSIANAERHALIADIWGWDFHLSFLTPEALHFWMPCFVRHAFSEEKLHNAEVAHTLTCDLVDEEMFPRRLYSREQTLAIRDFLRVARDYADEFPSWTYKDKAEKALALWDARLRAMTR